MILNPILKSPKDMNRCFSKDETDLANMQMKRGPLSLAVRKMTMKTTLRHYFTFTGTALIENTDKNKH